MTIKDYSYGTVVLTKTSMILLIKQLSAHGSYWALPKGHPNDGETNEMTAVREVNEECGTNLHVEDLVPDQWASESYHYSGELHGDKWEKHPDYPDNSKRPIVHYDKKVYYALAILPDIVPVNPQLAEVESVAWFPLEEGIKKLSHKSQQDVVRKLKTV